MTTPAEALAAEIHPTDHRHYPVLVAYLDDHPEITTKAQVMELYAAILMAWATVIRAQQQKGAA